MWILKLPTARKMQLKVMGIRGIGKIIMKRSLQQHLFSPLSTASSPDRHRCLSVLLMNISPNTLYFLQGKIIEKILSSEMVKTSIGSMFTKSPVQPSHNNVPQQTCGVDLSERGCCPDLDEDNNGAAVDIAKRWSLFAHDY